MENKYAQSIIFYENMLDYLAFIPERKTFHRRDTSMGNVKRYESLKDTISEEDESFTLNSSMVHIVTDYMDKRQKEDNQKAQALAGK